MESSGKKIIITVSNDIVTDQRMARIAHSLHKIGFQVEIIGRKMKNSMELEEKSYQQTRLHLWFDHGILFYAELNIRFFIFLLLHKADAIYAVDADTGLAALLVKKLKGIKMIFDAHELFSEVPEVTHRKFIKRIWQRIERWVIYTADRHITVSHSIAKHYHILYGKPFHVLRNVPEPYLVHQDVSDPRIILYQGALNKGRGLEELIKAIAELDMVIHLAGEGDITHELKALAVAHHVEDKVFFLGKVSPFNLKKETAKAWIGYNLLENDGLSYFYSLSNKTFDYMMAGLPQLIPPFPEYELLNKDWKFGIITKLDKDAIVAAIERLKSEPVLYQELKAGAINASKSLNWHEEALKLKEIITDLLR